MSSSSAATRPNYLPYASDTNPAQAPEDEVGSIDNIGSDSGSIIGVSIGRTQTYLTSPSVTDAEKSAILGADGDTGLVDEPQNIQEEDGEYPKPSDARRPGPEPRTPPARASTLSTPNRASQSRPRTSVTLPSPWRAGPNQAWNVRGVEQETYASMTQRLTRPRAATGPVPEDETGWRRYIPSMPKSAVLPRSTVTNSPRSRSPRRPQAVSNMHNPNAGHKQERQHDAGSGSTLPAQSVQTSNNHSSASSSTILDRNESLLSPPLSSTRRPSMVRRVTSEVSLHLYHTMSHASSLGDDERWQATSKQVNSRMKAIKDSLADSSIKLPRLPDIAPVSSWLDLQAARKYSNSILSSKDSRSTSAVQLDQAHDATPGKPGRNTSPAQKARPDAPATSKSASSKSSKLAEALEHLKGDVVILGGYRGSVLRSAKPPHRQLWVPLKVGFGLRKVDLEVGLHPEDEERMPETIVPSGMLKHIGPIEISKRLFSRLSASKNAADGTMRVWDFGYDWRLSPHLLSAQLSDFLKSLPCNAPGVAASDRGATVIAHSLGGLLMRRVINQSLELVRGIVYAGVPQNCVNILGPLRNGDSVLLAKDVLTAQVNFTIRTSYALLPLDGKCFFNPVTKEAYDVDFFDPSTWKDYCLTPTLARTLPPLLPPPPPSGIVGSMASVLPSFARPRRANSQPGSRSPPSPSINLDPTDASGGQPSNRAAAPQMNNNRPSHQRNDSSPEANLSTAVTIPKALAFAYLSRILPEIKAFKQSLAHKPGHAYPPTAVIYGKAVPTVYGAQVVSREAIRHSDAFDNLAFASGDGVVLARAAQIPEGYRVSKGGVVSSERGHVSLLGDLEAVGKCLCAIEADRQRRMQSKAHTVNLPEVE